MAKSQLSPAEFAVRPSGRRGSILMLSVFCMIVLMAMVALSVDTGYMYTLQSQLKRQVDAAALAGARELGEGDAAVQAKVVEYLVRNPVGRDEIVVEDEDMEARIAEFIAAHSDDLKITTGNWNSTNRSMESATENSPASTISVSLSYNDNPLFFGRALGKKTFDLHAEAIATFQPRDIMLVLDFSGSMNDDSTFAKINTLGRTRVEDSLRECVTDFGGMNYGSLPLNPAWATVKGVAQNDSQQIPHIRVEYRNTQVYVTSTKAITAVRLEFSNGATATTNPANNTFSGTYQGSGSNSGKQITKVYVRSWGNTNKFGTSYGEYFNFTSNTIRTTLKNALGLNSVTYPVSGGSWDGYMDYCMSSSGQNADAGYRYKFGKISLMNYWLDQHASYAENPNLWKVRAEPVNSLRQATDIFMDLLREVPAGDRVGFTIYNSNSGMGLLEKALTTDLDSVGDCVLKRQAGHYTPYTAIGDGMKTGRQHVQSNARSGAQRMMVLMTDGLPNYSNGSYNESAAYNQVLSEANSAKANKIKVMTISLGSGADKNLMQQVADITGGKHFNVPGGSTATAMKTQLIEAFEEIANTRELQLVK